MSKDRLQTKPDSGFSQPPKKKPKQFDSSRSSSESQVRNSFEDKEVSSLTTNDEDSELDFSKIPVEPPNKESNETSSAQDSSKPIDQSKVEESSISGMENDSELDFSKIPVEPPNKESNETSSAQDSSKSISDSNPREARNIAKFAEYTKDLRQNMEAPAAQDPKLASLVRKLYRLGAKVGSGSTAAAIRKERETGKPVGGRLHEQKGKEFIKALQKWLDKNPDASPQDRRTAENLILDLQDALKH
ncbi:MAG: hypothetical protein AAGA60_03715 [Cyanobacteria bacterium P01_E01_bin.42]